MNYAPIGTIAPIAPDNSLGHSIFVNFNGYRVHNGIENILIDCKIICNECWSEKDIEYTYNINTHNVNYEFSNFTLIDIMACCNKPKCLKATYKKIKSNPKFYKNLESIIKIIKKIIIIQ